MRKHIQLIALTMTLAIGACGDDEPSNTGGSGGTGGSGAGATGGTSCVDDACPGEATDCSTPACVNGACGFTHEAERSPCDDGSTDAASICNGVGDCVECIDDTDCDGGFLCVADTCVAGTGRWDEGAWGQSLWGP